MEGREDDETGGEMNSYFWQK